MSDCWVPLRVVVDLYDAREGVLESVMYVLEGQADSKTASLIHHVLWEGCSRALYFSDTFLKRIRYLHSLANEY